MALGSNISATTNPRYEFSAVAPVSVSATWTTIVDAGGPAIQDAATIIDPNLEITSATRHILVRRGQGTHLLLRLVYDENLTSITAPIVKVFGRANSTEIWQLLYNASGSSFVTTLSVDSTNDVYLNSASIPAMRATTPNFTTQSIDCLGCDELLVGVQTALAGTGDTSSSYIQGKII